MAPDAVAPTDAAPTEEPSGPSPYEQKSPYYAKRIELFEKYFAREGERKTAAEASNETKASAEGSYLTTIDHDESA